MNIDILIPNFEDLGAQRVAINVANGLSETYNIRFVILDDNGPFIDYLNKGIEIVNLANLVSNIPKIRVITKAVTYAKEAIKNKTDIAISFSPITNFYILYAKKRNNQLRTIIQEHAFPSIALKDRGNSPWWYERLFKMYLFKFYNSTDIFLTIAEAIKDDFINNFKIRNDIFEIVRNPIDISAIELKKNEDVCDFEFKKDIIYIIGIGRLAPQKNFSRLIKIFNSSLKAHDNINLIILGKGPEENILYEYVKKLNLTSKVHFLGFKKNPYQYLGKCDLFCLTSDWEGLPQVIAEAMICKTLVIAHKCLSGPDEMINNNETGILVEFNNDEQFVSKINNFINNKNKWNSVINSAYSFASTEYSISHCISRYYTIIDKLNTL